MSDDDDDDDNYDNENSSDKDDDLLNFAFQDSVWNEIESMWSPDYSKFSNWFRTEFDNLIPPGATLLGPDEEDEQTPAEVVHTFFEHSLDGCETSEENLQKLDAMLANAMDPVNRIRAAQLLERAVTFADEWELPYDTNNVLRELSVLHIGNRDFEKALTVLERLKKRQIQELDNNSSLQSTELALGICFREMRMHDDALRNLRSSLVRFQAGDSDDTEAFIECLCTLAATYMDLGNTVKARSFIKQAYRLLPDETCLKLQGRVLEEMGAVLLAESKYKAALNAYHRLLDMRRTLLETERTDVVGPMYKIALIHFAMHDISRSEQWAIQAAIFYQELKYSEPNLRQQILSSLSGILHRSGQFYQAAFVEEGSLNLKIGVKTATAHLMKRAEYWEKKNDLEKAKNTCRQALCASEGKTGTNPADHIRVLVKLYLYCTSKQENQKKSLVSEIEDILKVFMCTRSNELVEDLRRLAILFQITEQKNASAEISKLCDILEKERGSRFLTNTNSLKMLQMD